MSKQREGRPAPSIRTLFATSVVAITLVAALVTTALVRTAVRFETATTSIVRDAQSWALAGEVQLTLLMYQRISNLYTVTREPTLDETRDQVVVDLMRLLDTAEQYASSKEEQMLIDQVRRYFERYLDERAEIEAMELDFADVLARTQEALAETVDLLEQLHDLNEAQVFAAQMEAVRWNRLAVIVAALSASVLAGGLLFIAIGAHRYVLRPILELHDTIERFRKGSEGARMPQRGLREIQELVQRFNEMADVLTKQRERQLTFLAGIAHDLRSPLTAIKIGMQAIAEEQSVTRRNRAHAMLDRQIDRLARMVDDLLDATRIEAGRLDMRFENFDLRDVISDMIGLYAPTSPDHDIQAAIPEEPVVIAADSHRIEQVISNLLSNAIKFSPRGGPIRIALETAGDEVVLTVADQGIGIRPEDREEIFLPFQRSSADVAPGAGLGLSVVRRIVEAHGGYIDVEGEPLHGSVFRVVLPVGGASMPVDPPRPDESARP